jgi:pyridoxal phosphate enzyme (YggS family)
MKAAQVDRKSEIELRLNSIQSQLKPGVTLIVVTKTFPASDVQILYDLGQREFGENRDAEGSLKSRELPSDAVWHFQGGIQSNKLKSIVEWSDYIHSLDDLSHAKKISELAIQYGKKQKCFIQINLDLQGSANKERGGIAPLELESFCEAAGNELGLQIVGVMGVGPLNEDPVPAFELLQNTSHRLEKLIPGAKFISAGMSGDFQVAMEYGATHVRLGSSILGTR